MTADTEKIAQTYRDAGHVLSEEDCEKVYGLCERKMELCKIEDRDSYMPLLFHDELRNFLVRRFMNMLSMTLMDAEEVRSNV
jgi:hypothetical protein